MTKPPKPSPDFPLFAHNNGVWAKKMIKGKWYYFGPWANPHGALERYHALPHPTSVPLTKFEDAHHGRETRKTDS